MEVKWPKRKRTIIAAAFVAYVIGYLTLRSGHVLVHSVVRSDSYTYLEHSIAAGDMGMGGGNVGIYAAIFYTPLRFAERSYWYWKHPVGAPLSAADRNRPSK